MRRCGVHQILCPKLQPGERLVISDRQMLIGSEDADRSRRITRTDRDVCTAGEISLLRGDASEGDNRGCAIGMAAQSDIGERDTGEAPTQLLSENLNKSLVQAQTQLVNVSDSLEISEKKYKNWKIACMISVPTALIAGLVVGMLVH